MGFTLIFVFVTLIVHTIDVTCCMVDNAYKYYVLATWLVGCLAHSYSISYQCTHSKHMYGYELSIYVHSLL